MKIIEFIKQRLSVMCVLFTCFVFTFSLFLGVMGEASNGMFSIDRLAILLLFAFILSLANLVFKIKKLHVAVTVAIHFVLSYAGMYLCVFGIFYNTSGMSQHKDYTVGQVLVASVVFAIIYVAVIALKLLIEKKLMVKKENKPYTKQFKSLEEK